MTLRKTTSLTTLISFILLLVTSVILYVTPQGKIAFWASWKMGGLGKEQWGALHTNLGFLFLIAGVVHTVLNWKPIVAYLKNKAAELKVFTVDFNLALGISLFIVVFTLFELPPIVGVQRFNENLKTAAAKKYGEPPYGHAEVSPLQMFCKRVGIDAADATRKLEAAGLKEVSEKATLADIAKANGKTPQEVYDLIKPEPTAGLPENPGSGLGRRTLAELCATYGQDAGAMAAKLKEIQIEAGMEETMKEIADKNDLDPHALYEAMLQLQ